MSKETKTAWFKNLTSSQQYELKEKYNTECIEVIYNNEFNYEKTDN